MSTLVWLSPKKEAWLREWGGQVGSTDSVLLSSTRKLYNVMVGGVALESELSSQRMPSHGSLTWKVGTGPSIYLRELLQGGSKTNPAAPTS